MKTLNFDILEMCVLTNDEMIQIRGGNEGDPTPLPGQLPIKV
jgi:hypothetical protein